MPGADLFDWRQVINTLPQGVVVLSPKQEALFTNQACHDLLGFDIAECGGVEPWLRSMCPSEDHAEKVVESWREHVWRKQLNRTYTLKGADGKVREIQFHAALQSDGGIVMTVQDVTQARRTEDTLRLSKLKFRGLFSNVKEGIVLVDKSGRILDANGAFLKLTGLQRVDLRLSLLSDLIHPRDAQALIDEQNRLIQSPKIEMGDIFEQKTCLQIKSAEKQTSLTFCPVVTHEGEYTMGVCIFRESEPGREGAPESSSSARTGTSDLAITKLKALAMKAQALLNAVPELIILINTESEVIDFAPPSKPWSELAINDDWIGHKISESWPALGEVIESTKERIFSGGKMIRSELSGPENGTGRFVVTLAQCGADQAMAVVQNTSEIGDLRAGLRRHKLLLEHAREAVLLTDGDGLVVDANPAAESLFSPQGYELVGQKLATLYQRTDGSQAPDFDQELRKKIKLGESWEIECLVDLPDEDSVILESIFVPLEAGVLNLVTRKQDPTEDAQATQQTLPPSERTQHQLRNQLQLVTSLFALEPRNREDRMAALKWQTRLRSLVHACPAGESETLSVVTMLRSIADEVSSVAGRGPGRREIVVTGPDSLKVSASLAGPFALLVAEIMRMVICGPYKSKGPKLYLDLERCAHGEISLTVKPGAKGRLFSPEQQGEAETLELLTQQIRGQIQASLDAENVGSLQVTFDGQAA